MLPIARHNSVPLPSSNAATDDRAAHVAQFTAALYNSRLMDVHRYLNIHKVSLHVAMSMLSYLVTALAYLKADDYAHMRHMRIKLPKAQRKKAQQPQEEPISNQLRSPLLMTAA